MRTLIINEARIFAARPNRAEWWYTWRTVAEDAGIVTPLANTADGDRLRIDCISEGHAVSLAAYLRRYGVPRSAIKRVNR